MPLDLAREELELLEGILTAELDALREEVHHTDARRLRAELKTDEQVLRSILAKVHALAVGAR